MKRVLLLNPPARRKVIRDYYCSKSTKSNYLFQPIDLVMQSGVLAPHCQLHALDAVARRLSIAECMSEIERIKPEAVLGLWGAVSDSEDREFYRALAERFESPIFISGEVALDDPGRWLKEHDYIKGALLRFVSTGLLDYLCAGAPGPDLAVNEGGRIRGGPDPSPPREFSLGRPRHELFGERGYHFSFARGRRFATVLTDFGCPFKCGFCVMSGLGYRTRPLPEVVSEFKWLRDRGVRELFVSDQCFGASKKRTLELCAALAESAPGLGFTTFTRPDLVDDDLLEALKRAGGHTLIMGVETADPDTLEKYHKGYSPDRVREGFQRCRAAGVRTVATFIIGLPEDTEDSIIRTMGLARELDPDFVSYNVAVPRSGTSLKTEAEREGLLEPGVDPDQAGDVFAMRTRSLAGSELAGLKRRAVRDFYLRPGYLLGRVRRAGSLRELMAQAREGMALLRKNV